MQTMLVHILNLQLFVVKILIILTYKKENDNLLGNLNNLIPCISCYFIKCHGCLKIKAFPDFDFYHVSSFVTGKRV